MARKFNGSTDYISAPVNLNYTKIVTIAFWLRWNNFANDDMLAMEYGANYSANSGILIDPNSGNGKFDFGFGNPAVAWIDGFTRPSAGVWHHYVLVMDRENVANTAYVDGQPQSLSTTLHNGSYNDVFGNNSLFLMCRNGASLFGAGSMTDLAIWNIPLTAFGANKIFRGARPGVIRPQNLVGYYPLGGDTTYAADLSAYNRMATLHGTLRTDEPPGLIGPLPKLRHTMWALGAAGGATAGLRYNSSLSGLGSSGPFFHDRLSS